MQLPVPPAAVTFDCWSTLIDNRDWESTKTARNDALIRVASAHGKHLTDAEADDLVNESWRIHIEAWRRLEVFGGVGAARFCLAKIDLGGDETVVELVDAWADATTGTEAFEGARDAVASVRAAGIPTALVCDTGFTPAPTVRKYLDGHGFTLDHYIFSEEVGAPKPSPKIFEAAITALGVEPSRAVHIGDLRRTDIAGARAAGMASIRYTGGHDDGWEGEESQGDEADAVASTWSKALALLGLG